jgi:mannose-6-phosphate isomerase-like protein (cupin superfamily)
MRLIITGHDDDGRSTVASDRLLPDEGMRVLSTTTGIGKGTGVAAAAPHIETVPESGAASWVFVDVPPEAQLRAALASGVVGIDAEGWHTTPTVDYVLILNGTISLALDTREVELHAGDCVVQQGTRHAWRNRTESPVRMACVMIRP